MNGVLSEFFEENPEEIGLVKAKLCDRIDPPRIVAIIGPSELNHARYVCVVSISETADFTLGDGPKGRTATIGIEVRHLHLVSGKHAERIRHGPKDEMRADQVGRKPTLPAGRYFESEVQ